MNADYQVLQSHKNNLAKAWVNGVELDTPTTNQIMNIADMPFIHKWVAVMPDAHLGKGATVGTVIATKQAIIPAAVGVDLGCGMIAAKTPYFANDLPDSLKELRTEIERSIPVGGPGVKGSWAEAGRYGCPRRVGNAWAKLYPRYERFEHKYPQIKGEGTATQLCTLGTGNHFIEICLEHDVQNSPVWIMVHSGSRGVGNRIASYFIAKAKEDMRRWHINLPDKDLAYIPEGSEFFQDYCTGVEWAQEYALRNRELMLDRVYATMNTVLGKAPYGLLQIAANCHHNYISREHHFGENVWVTRKGAVRARQGDFGIIPGSMGAKSFIVRGKGNPESFDSCSHGAGRRLSRGEAKRQITPEQHAEAVKGVECRLDNDVLDESPAAYKDIDAVMAAQSSLVDIVTTLKQVLCVKG